MLFCEVLHAGNGLAGPRGVLFAANTSLGDAMKKLLLAASAVLMLIGAGQAADMPVKAPRVVAAPAAFSWTGFYIGGTLGYGWGRARHEDGGATTSPEFDIKGPTAGVTVGVNYQINRIVIGFEGDWSWADIDGSTPTGGGFGCDTACATEIKSFATARGRFGVTVVDRLLAYGTAGWAWTRISGTLGPLGGDGHQGWLDRRRRLGVCVHGPAFDQSRVPARPCTQLPV